MSLTTIPPSTRPSAFTMLTTMTLPLALDASERLEGDETISSAVVTLLDVTTGQTVELADEPTIEVDQIVQIVRGPTQLVKGHKFLLVWTYTVAEDTTWTDVTQLDCPL